MNLYQRFATDAGLGGDVPQQNLTGYTRYVMKKLFFSQREVALLLEKTMRGGYGEVEMGTILAQDSNTDSLVPYVEQSSINLNNVGNATLLNDCNGSADSDTTFYLTIEDSYKFAEGDTIVIKDTGGNEEATIDTIARYEDQHRALITLTASPSSDYKVSNDANVYLKGADTPVYITDAHNVTGVENNNGGLTSVVVSNAVIYQSGVPNMDANALSSFSDITEDGQFYIIK